jgi:hypothetical protein
MLKAEDTFRPSRIKCTGSSRGSQTSVGLELVRFYQLDWPLLPLDNRRVAQESLSDLIESIRSRVQAELDAQLPALAARHEEAVAEARREAEAAAARLTADTVATARRDAEADADRRTREAVAAARREAEAETERRISARMPAPARPMSRTILNGLSAIDEARNISDMLRAIAEAASEQGASLFVGPELERWPAAPGGQPSAPTDLVKESFAAARVLRRDGAIAAPLLLDGIAVGVLHAASPADEDAEALDIIARYGATRLGLLTATRTMQAQRWITSASAPAGNGLRASERKAELEQADDDEVQSARRYARLLLSEIKLYNETAVNEGREHRDLSRRLSSEIDRARRLYEERVPSTIPDRAGHFSHELIQTLAGGDPTLLG